MAKISARDILKKILLSLRRNWGLKLVSLLFAIILWNYVIVEGNPMVTRTFTGIPVNVTPGSLQQLKNTGLTVSGDISKWLKPVSVTITLPRNESFQFSKNFIQVNADLSGITQSGVADVRLQVVSTKGSVKSYSPQVISVKIEKRDKRIVPVNCITDGTLPANYWRGKPQATPDTLEVSGPAASVKLVDRAEVHVDLTGQTGSVSRVRDVILLDSSNNVLDRDALGLECQSSCIVNLDILPTKTIAIDAKNSLNGSPAWGYEQVGDPAVDPASITVAGPQETLDAMGDKLTLSGIDISGAKANVSVSRSLPLPQGTRVVGADTVQVLVNIQMKMTSVTIKDVRVTIEGLDSSLKANKAFTADVTINCPLIYASGIRRSQLHVTADASGLGAGTHSLALKATYSDPDIGLTDDAFTIDPGSISVTLTAKSTTSGKSSQ